MKIGVLVCGYDCAAEINEVLAPWKEAKENKLCGHEFVLSMVYGQFTEWAELFGTKTFEEKQKDCPKPDGVDHMRWASENSEAGIRNLALKSLLESDCDVIWLLDADEYYTVANLQAILNVITLSPWEAWFSIAFKNYVFNKKEYLIDPFQPPRIFRVSTCGYKLKEFYYDNDVTYAGTIVEGNSFVNKQVSYKELPSKVIPQNRAWVRHESWLNNQRSKAKVAYQEKHFAHGAGCSFAWDKLYDSLTWNPEYFKKTGQTIPRTAHD